MSDKERNVLAGEPDNAGSSSTPNTQPSPDSGDPSPTVDQPDIGPDQGLPFTEPTPADVGAEVNGGPGQGIVQDQENPLPGEVQALKTIAAIRCEFERSNRAAYETLGDIYAASPDFKIGSSGHGLLIKAVQERWQDKISYSLAQKEPEQLFLTLLFGTEEKRSQKSQWATALKNAAKIRTGRTREKFVEWIERSGGIDGANRGRRSAKAKKVTPQDIEEMLTPSGKTVEIPLPEFEPMEVGRYAIQIVLLPPGYDGSQPVNGEVLSVEVEKAEVEASMRQLYGAAKRRYQRQVAMLGDEYGKSESAKAEMKKPEYISKHVMESNSRGLFSYWGDVLYNRKEKSRLSKYQPKKKPGSMSYYKVNYFRDPPARGTGLDLTQFATPSPPKEPEGRRRAAQK